MRIKPLVVGLVFLIIAGFAYAGLTGSLDPKAIIERIKPVGQVHTAEKSDLASNNAAKQNPQAHKSGNTPEKIYGLYCKTCHAIGLAGAPKLADKANWAKRLKQGKAVLLEHVLRGYKAMPPKGGCMECSEAEFRETIDYMLEGGS